MTDRLPHEKGFHISWDQIHRDSRALAWRLDGKGPLDGGWKAVAASELRLFTLQNLCNSRRVVRAKLDPLIDGNRLGTDCSTKCWPKVLLENVLLRAVFGEPQNNNYRDKQ